MSEMPTLSLMVIRVTDIDRSAAFYAALGFTFTCEQHGKGPVHYNTTLGDKGNGTVFELYPASERFPVTPFRLGFAVASIQTVLERWRRTGYDVCTEPKASPWGPRAVVTDPDGYTIELTQKAKSLGAQV